MSLTKNISINKNLNFVLYSLLGIGLMSVFALGTNSHAQGSQFDDAVELEELYDQFETQEVRRTESQRRVEQARRADIDPVSISDLGDLAPFEDIAVIQRKFLPKTNRLELSGLGLLSVNNAFFNNFGLSLRLGYAFHEKYGVEATYTAMASAKRDITDGLEKRQRISTESLVEPESYMGLSFKWTPIYGKMAWFQRQIIPFDLYFTPGLGMTKTALGENETTLSLGVGQIFALSKSSGVRWDFAWNFYQATIRPNTAGSITNETTNHSDLLFSIGYSFFIPEAKYR